MNKQDLIFILSPFILTGIFIVLGYNILVSQTPEASITIPETEETYAEILEEDISPTKAQIPAIDSVKGYIQPVPQAQQLLDTAIATAKANDINTIYFTIPVKLTADMNLELSEKDSSSEENIIRWTKKSINTAHEAGYQTWLAMTINASQTVSDPVTFANNYNEFIATWAGLATEYNVHAFVPGITISHPLYGELTPEEMNTFLTTAERSIRRKFSGILAVNICCTTEIPANTAGFNAITIIPTPEYTFSDMGPIVVHFQQSGEMADILLYDRSIQVVTSAPTSSAN